MPTSPDTWRPLLSRGMQGQDVVSWQAHLFREGLLAAADVLGVFGPKTEKATIAFQIAHGLKPDGVVGEKTRALLDVALPAQLPPPDVFDSRWQFLQPANYTKVTMPRAVALVTMHSMEH